MSNSLSESVIKKIQMAKLFYGLASDCYRIIENIERIGAGIILLQDSVELFLIAICEHVNVENRENLKFHEYFKEIKKKVPGKIIPFKDDMLKLNKQRVSLKHYGIRPYIDDCKTFHKNVYSFFKETSKSHLKIDFDSISLVNLLSAYSGVSGRQFRRHPDIKPEHPDILSIQFLLTLFLINNYHLVHIKLKDLKEFNLKSFTLFLIRFYTIVYSYRLFGNTLLTYRSFSCLNNLFCHHLPHRFF